MSTPMTQQDQDMRRMMQEHPNLMYGTMAAGGGLAGGVLGTVPGAAAGLLLAILTKKSKLKGLGYGALAGGALGAAAGGLTRVGALLGAEAALTRQKQASGPVQKTPEYRAAIRWLMQKRAADLESTGAQYGITPANNMSLDDVSRLNRRADARQVMGQMEDVGQEIGNGLEGPVSTSADLIGGLASGLWNGAKTRAAEEAGKILDKPGVNEGNIPGLDQRYPGDEAVFNEFNKKGLKPRPAPAAPPTYPPPLPPAK